MYDIEKRKNLSGCKVDDLIKALWQLPKNAIVAICGVTNVWLHVSEDGKVMCLDHENLSDDYSQKEERLTAEQIQSMKYEYLKKICEPCKIYECAYNTKGLCKFALVFEEKPAMYNENGCSEYLKKKGCKNE